MGYFPATIAARLAGRTVRLARLVLIDFADGPGRYWDGGTGNLAAGGQVWLGTGALTTISGIESALGGKAPQVTLGMSGIAAADAARLATSEVNVKGRSVQIFVQFYDDAFLPLDAPYSVYVGIADVMSAKLAGPATSSIQLTCEGLFTSRARPPWGYLSDRSQQGLYPGDAGLQEVASMRLRQPAWPVF